MDVLAEILRIRPDFTDAAIFLGNLAYDAKFAERAEAAYEQAARHGNPEALYGLKNLAYDAHAAKRDAEAVRILEKALALFPGDATVEADLLQIHGEESR